MLRNTVRLLLIIVLVVPAMVALAQSERPADQGIDLELRDQFRQQLEKDREQLYEMSRQERQQYIAQYFQAPEREKRRAFKAALEQFRLEWDIQDTGKDKRVEAVEPSRGGKAVKVAGTNITYDTGTVFGTAGIASQMLGNRFDSGLNTGGTMCCFPVETTGSVTMITFDMVNTFFGSVVWSLYSNIMGTTAAQVTSMARPGIVTGLNTLSVMSPTTANVYMNGTFLAGIWQFDPTMTGLAVDTGTVGGQGFHAISLNDGAMGSMLTTVTTAGMGLNAIFRVSGNVATPVELMEFTIE
ncbi:MAG: hypothetical protein MPN21_12495 [Thermoanaerobaculia bacterium]|nr:hypothetical protein [Thermoanaerobaculia bacterium]